MAPINDKIKFITADPYPKARAASSVKASPSPRESGTSTNPVETYSPNTTNGRDPQIMDMQRAARESGRTATFGNNGGKGDPTGLPQNWRHSVQANGVNAYRDVLDESAYRPNVTVRKKKRNAPPPKTESPSKAETKSKPSPPKNSSSLWRPESIGKYRVIPKKTEAPEPQAEVKKPKRTGAESIGPPGNSNGEEQRTTTSRRYETEEEAKTAFRRQSESLLRPGGWNSKPIGLSYVDSPKWSVLDDKGQETRNNPRVKQGDVLKIANPGKTNYFVEVERAHSSDGNVQFTVRPTNDPNMPKGSETTHFFTKESTRTFTLQRVGKEVIFNTEGKNETLNISSEAGPFAVGNAAGGGMIMNGGGDAYWGQFARQLMNR